MNRSKTGVWGLRLFALLAAVGVWFSVSFVKRERVSEKLIDATVTYNPSRGLIILDPLQTVKVRLRGPDRQIRTLAPHVVDVVIEVSGVAAGTLDVQLGESNVLRPEGLEVVAIEPNSIPLRAGITAATTSPISLDGHALSFKQTVSVVPPDPLVRIVQPSVVTVEVPMHFPGTAGERAEAP